MSQGPITFFLLQATHAAGETPVMGSWSLQREEEGGSKHVWNHSKRH